MAEFVVYRHGRNSSDQPHADLVPVAAVNADSAQHAIDLVRRTSRLRMAGGQFLSAVSRSDAPDEDWQTAAATEFMEEVILQHF